MTTMFSINALPRSQRCPVSFHLSAPLAPQERTRGSGEPPNEVPSCLQRRKPPSLPSVGVVWGRTANSGSVFLRSLPSQLGRREAAATGDAGGGVSRLHTSSSDDAAEAKNSSSTAKNRANKKCVRGTITMRTDPIVGIPAFEAVRGRTQPTDLPHLVVGDRFG